MVEAEDRREEIDMLQKRSADVERENLRKS
jgi:hypothetical protein